MVSYNFEYLVLSFDGKISQKTGLFRTKEHNFWADCSLFKEEKHLDNPNPKQKIDLGNGYVMEVEQLTLKGEVRLFLFHNGQYIDSFFGLHPLLSKNTWHYKNSEYNFKISIFTTSSYAVTIGSVHIDASVAYNMLVKYKHRGFEDEVLIFSRNSMSIFEYGDKSYRMNINGKDVRFKNVTELKNALTVLKFAFGDFHAHKTIGGFASSNESCRVGASDV